MYIGGMQVAKPKLVRRNICMWDDEYRSLVNYSAEHRLAVSAVIRTAVRDYIKGKRHG